MVNLFVKFLVDFIKVELLHLSVCNLKKFAIFESSKSKKTQFKIFMYIYTI